MDSYHKLHVVPWNFITSRLITNCYPEVQSILAVSNQWAVKFLQEGREAFN